MEMKTHNINPEKVTTPIQLLAVWFIALLLLTGSFFATATQIKEPIWISPLLIISGIVLVIIFVILIFLMQTRFRPEMLPGNEYLQYIDKMFKNFKPENLNKTSKIKEIDDLSLEEKRISEYHENSGLFLTHISRPSKSKGQIADIRIKLFQHGEGPLTLNQIENVEYELGRKFFKKPVIKTNSNENYAIDVSAYAPMLCVAKVNMKDKKAIILSRYIDFEY